MIVAKKQYSSANVSVYGNYALDNKRYYEENEADIALKRNKKLKHKKQIVLRFKMVTAVLLLFFTSVMIVSRYAAIANIKNQTINIKKAITVQQKENDNLKLQLMKHSDIKEIERVATTELNMVQPGKSNNLRVSIKVNSNTDNDSADRSQSGKVDMINRLKSAFSKVFS